MSGQTEGACFQAFRLATGRRACAQGDTDVRFQAVNPGYCESAACNIALAYATLYTSLATPPPPG
jgi:hypothetical protein